jgi:hypothetical protein
MAPSKTGSPERTRVRSSKIPRSALNDIGTYPRRAAVNARVRRGDGSLHRVCVTLCCDRPAIVIKIGKAEFVTSLEDKEICSARVGTLQAGKFLPEIRGITGARRYDAERPEGE